MIDNSSSTSMVDSVIYRNLLQKHDWEKHWLRSFLTSTNLQDMMETLVKNKIVDIHTA